MRPAGSPAAFVLAALLAALPAFAAGAAAAPEQVHAALDSTGVSVAWARPGDVRATVADTVQWDDGSGLLDREATPSAPVLIEPGTTLLQATLPVRDGTVTYRVGSDRDGWSATHTLTLPPAQGPVRIAVYGDHGVGAGSNASLQLIPRVAAEAPHVVLHAGDLSYADGDAAVWDAWFRLIEPLAAGTLYMAATGNHEHEGYYPASGPNPELAPAAGALADPYHQFRSRFAFPGDELWYSFDAGPVHVLVVNSEDLCATQPATYRVPWRVSPPCDPGTSDQSVAEGQANAELLAFIRADLEAHRDAAWTFVMFHRPVHSAGSYVGEPVLQRDYVPLFEELGVDLVLTGHDHTYQRSFPLKGLQPASSSRDAYAKDLAPIYIVSGGGGEELYTLQPEQPAWTAARGATYHHLLLDVHPEGLRGQVVNTTDGAILDTFTVGAWDDEPGGQAPAGREAPASAAALVAVGLAAGVARIRRRS